MSNRTVYLDDDLIIKEWLGKIRYLLPTNIEFEKAHCTVCFNEALCYVVSVNRDVCIQDGYGNITTKTYLCADCLKKMTRQIHIVEDVFQEIEDAQSSVAMGDKLVKDDIIYTVTKVEFLGVLLKQEDSNAKAFFVDHRTLMGEYEKE